MPAFKFDFDAIKGLTYEEGFVTLFQQLEDHYNANVNVKPSFVFGADPAQPGADRSISATHDDPLPSTTKKPYSADLIRVKDDYEIKQGKDLGLKDGFVLTGVSSEDVEIFDFLKNYTEGDTVVEGESGKYDLGKAR